MIEIKFPADNPAMALAFANALMEIAGQPTVTAPPVEADTTGATVVTEETAVTTTTTTTADTRADNKRVAFDAEYCGNAQKPFYGSGKLEGQWKKRQGVDQAAYDQWYAGEVAKLEPATEQEVDAAAAFAAADSPAPPGDAPTNCGEFMNWASKLMVAKRLTQQDVQDAYAAAGLSTADLMPPTPPEQMVFNIQTVYALVSEKVGAE